MRRSFKSRLRALGSRRAIMVMIILLMVGLLVFAEIIRPDQDARSYSKDLQAATQPLEKCFEKLANTTTLDIYYAPDIAIQDRQKDAATISKQVAACRQELNHFNEVTGQLLSLHLAGYTQTYHQAKVYQRQAMDIIGQSSDVLNQYGDLADMLSQYYAHIKVFLDDFAYLQSVEQYAYPTNGMISQLAGQAKDLHQRAADIRGLKTTSNFDQMRLATADMFDRYATGFDYVVQGYANYNDATKKLGFDMIDLAVSDYDSTVIVLPFKQLQSSYIPKQVQQLPVKVRNLLAAQKE